MHIFGDPSHIPIVIVERVMNAPRRSTSENSYLRHLDVITSSGLLSGTGSETVEKLSGTNRAKNGRILKIVVFVHGFQASLVLFCFSLICRAISLCLARWFNSFFNYFHCAKFLLLDIQIMTTACVFCIGFKKKKILDFDNLLHLQISPQAFILISF